MKKIIVVLFLSFTSNCDYLLGQENNFCTDYPEYCQKTFSFYKENKKHFSKMIDNDSIYDIQFLFSIVAPEIARFDLLRNEIEVKALELLYVRFGKDYANFSIGYFQMKPSFIESLEQVVKKSLHLREMRKYHDFVIEGYGNEVRLKRLNRLKSLKWQIRYLCCFIDIINYKFRFETFKNQREKLRFYATVYNLGIDAKRVAINHWQKAKKFPGLPIPQKYNYAEVSIYFFEELNKIDVFQKD